MILPVLDKPIYKTNILSRDTPIEFTPFTMKEQKILMMARESKEVDSIVTALRQILSNCLIDKTIVVNDLPMVDLEWLFLNIQAKSSGEIVNLVFKCNNMTMVPSETGELQESECGMLIDCAVNLLEVKIENKNYNRRIMLSDTVGIQMKFPSFEVIQKSIEDENSNEEYLMAALCIDYIFDAKSVYQAKDATQEELLNFIEQLSEDNYSKIEEFFSNCPTIKETIQKTCPRCGYNHSIELEGLEDFFS
jgi:hypothetical protein